MKNIREEINEVIAQMFPEMDAIDPPGFRYFEPSWPCCATCVYLMEGDPGGSDYGSSYYCGRYKDSEEARFYSYNALMEMLNYDEEGLSEDFITQYICDEWEEKK